MKVLFPPTAACLIVAMIATVSYAENESSAVDSSAVDSSAIDSTAVSESLPAEEQDKDTNDKDTGGKDTEEKVASEKDTGQKDTKENIVQLSVPPEDQPIYPDDRPAWVNEPPRMEGSEYVWVVQSSQESIERCEDAIEALKRATVRLYAKDLTDSIIDDDAFSASWIEDELVAKTYVGKLTQGDRELFEVATELRFDAKARECIRSVKRNAIVKERLAASGGLFALALVGLVCSGGLLSVVSRRYS